jgi:hypothetical protein
MDVSGQFHAQAALPPEKECFISDQEIANISLGRHVISYCT